MNISGVTTDGIGMANRSSRSAVSTQVSISARAVSILRCEPAVTRPRVDATRLAVSKVPNGVVMIGSRRPRPDTSDSIDGCSSRPPLRITQDSDGKPSAAWALTTASTTSERSPGVITPTPSVKPLQHMLGRHAGHQHIHHLALQQRRIAAQHRALDRELQFGHRGGHQQRLLGQHIRFRLEALQRLRRLHPSAPARIGSPRPQRCGRAGPSSRPGIHRRPVRPDRACGPWRSPPAPPARRDWPRFGRSSRARSGPRRRCSRCRRSAPHRIGPPPGGTGRRCRRSLCPGRRAAADS